MKVYGYTTFTTVLAALLGIYRIAGYFHVDLISNGWCRSKIRFRKILFGYLKSSVTKIRPSQNLANEIFDQRKKNGYTVGAACV